MGQSLARILVHTVFSTKHRRPLLRTQEIREEMNAYLAGALRKIDCPAIFVGSVEDHVYTLSSLSKNVAGAELVEKVKASSSKWIKTKGWWLGKDRARHNLRADPGEAGVLFREGVTDPRGTGAELIRGKVFPGVPFLRSRWNQPSSRRQIRLWRGVSPSRVRETAPWDRRLACPESPGALPSVKQELFHSHLSLLTSGRMTLVFGALTSTPYLAT